MANKQRPNPNQVRNWFIGKARSAAGYRRNILANTERAKAAPAIGKMYFYFYDPKWKKILPIYDRFPLTIPIEQYSDGFLGLNLHYLSQGERAQLLDELRKFASDPRLTARTRLKLSYDLLSRTKNLNSLSKPCIKRYLFSQVRSEFIEIIPNEWDYAIELPVEIFVTKR